jgi:hypothetical protein
MKKAAAYKIWVNYGKEKVFQAGLFVANTVATLMHIIPMEQGTRNYQICRCPITCGWDIV